MTFSAIYAAAVTVTFLVASVYSLALGRIGIGMGCLFGAIFTGIIAAWAISRRNL